MGKSKTPQVGAARRSTALVKAYRSKLAKAKRMGLVKKSIPVKGSSVSKYMRTKLNRLEPVLEGRVSAIKAPPAAIKRYREAGAKIVNGRILVEGHPDSVASIRRGEYDEHVIFQRRPLDRDFYEEEVTFPISTHNVKDLLNFLEANSDKLQKHKNPRDQWGFKIQGARSLQGFDSFAAMVDYMQFYKNIGTIEAVDLNSEPEFLTIFRVNRGAWTQKASQTGIAAKRRRWKTAQDRREGERKVSMRDKPAAMTDAERQARRRERLAADPGFAAKEAERKRTERAKKKGAPIRPYKPKGK